MTSVTPVILKDSNHTSIHLAPFPVVARVVAPSVGQGASAALSSACEVLRKVERGGAASRGASGSARGNEALLYFADPGFDRISGTQFGGILVQKSSPPTARQSICERPYKASGRNHICGQVTCTSGHSFCFRSSPRLHKPQRKSSKQTIAIRRM